MSEASLAFAFSAGLVASLNPCAFAMLPAFVAYYLGLDDDAARPGLARRLVQGLAVGLSMTAGFLAVFAVLGAFVSLAGRGLLRYQDVVGVAVGLALGGLGAWLAGGRELHVFVPNPVRPPRERSLPSSAVYGVAYGLASLACTLPIFFVVVGAAFLEGSVVDGLSLFLAYSLGMGAVVVAVSVSAALFKGGVGRFLRYAMPLVQRASGALLILAGTFIAVRALDQAALGALAGLQPYTTEIGAVFAALAVVVASILAWSSSGGRPAPMRPAEKTGPLPPGRS